MPFATTSRGCGGNGTHSAVLLDYDDVDELPSIEAPALLIWGDADTQNQLADLIPDADLAVYPGVGHTPRWDDPVRFSGDVVRFAARGMDDLERAE
jgi:pimeloyl-ACP methyl ester carboxylesterase